MMNLDKLLWLVLTVVGSLCVLGLVVVGLMVLLRGEEKDPDQEERGPRAP